MKILNFNLVGFNLSRQNLKRDNSCKPNTTIDSKSSSFFENYPKNCYLNNISFARKFDDIVFDMQKKDISDQDRMKLFDEMTPAAKKNVYDMVQKFNKQGLTLDNYVKACIKHPQLFSRSSETIEKHIRGFVEKFEYCGLTLDNYVEACIKRPSLFSYSPETIENNVKKLVKAFKKDGMTTEKCIKACLINPQLFYHACDNIEKNTKRVVERFSKKGLDALAYFSACIKQPFLFSLSSDTIAEHIDVLRFASANNGLEIDTPEFFKTSLIDATKLTYSTKLLLIKYLIIPKMFENFDEIPIKGKAQEQKLKDYLITHPEQKYVINVSDIEAEADCVSLLKETCKKLSMETLGRDDIFIINVEKQKP